MPLGDVKTVEVDDRNLVALRSPILDPDSEFAVRVLVKMYHVALLVNIYKFAHCHELFQLKLLHCIDSAQKSQC